MHAGGRRTPSSPGDDAPESSSRLRAPLSTADAAWIAALPCALVVVAAIVLVGPWLGRTFMAPRGELFWQPTAIPEPEEHGRFVIALLYPLLVAAAMVALRRRGLPGIGRAATTALARSGELLAVGFAVVCLAAQRQFEYGPLYGGLIEPFRRVYFTLPTLAVAALLAVASIVVLHRPRATAWAGRFLRETPARTIVAAVAAVALTVPWLMTAVVLESSAQNTTWSVVGNILWSMNETYAVLDGTGPLTAFHSQYAQLWPYAFAVPMTLLGPSVGVYTITMVCLDLGALVAVFALLRRVVHSSLAALLLYLPFMATGFFMKLGPPDDRYGPANLFSVWPVRYAGPYLLAWLTARHVDRLAPRQTTLLLGCAGLVAINNPEFGIAAFCATLAALLWARPPDSWRPVARLAGSATLGLLAAGALVAVMTLAVAGQLPRFPQLFEFSRIYGLEGWAVAPMPTLGLHLIIYGTFAGAIVVATARAAQRSEGVVLTAMLGWSGVFGLLAGAYFAGRSHPEVLIDLFSAWALAVVLLVVVAVRAIAARPSRRPRPAELAVLVAFGVTACSLAQTPTPWSQVDRLRERGSEHVVGQPAAVRFVAAATKPGEPVVILAPLSHRIGYDAGVTNVAPYSGIESMPTRGQLDKAIAALRDAGGRRLFTAFDLTPPGMPAALRRAGFESVRGDGAVGYVEWIDRRGDAVSSSP
jgi:hypothetical protein